uniref:(California timema) hypothetical protein n=1 Tax=Timema californicum TaxID=61474 RepID=A0A7R9J9J1_TIMCA|nr:unnamed protein product [Timema californicum]
MSKLIPRPARSCEDPPLYLRLRMGKPINKKIPKSTPIMSYGKKKMRPEYWFSVPRNRVDELYSFLQLWVPHLYGDLDDMDPKSRGFELVESDTELWEDEGGDLSRRGTLERSSSSEDGDLGELTRESWEVIKAPYAKLYTILKTQTQSSESEPMEEVGPLPSTFKMAQISRSRKAFTSRKVSSRTSPLDELANALVVLSSTAEDGEIEVRISVGSPMASLVLTDSSQLSALKSYQTKLCIPTPNHMICKNMCITAVNVGCRSAPKKPWVHPTVISDLDLPVIGSLVYCESDVLDHVATEAVGPGELARRNRVGKFSSLCVCVCVCVSVRQSRVDVLSARHLPLLRMLRVTLILIINRRP